MAVTHKLEISFDPLFSTNLVALTNSTFDVDLAGWVENDADASLTPTRDTVVKRSGAGSLKMVNTTHGDDFFQQAFATVPGISYLVSAWVNVTAYGGILQNGLMVVEVTPAVRTSQTKISAVTSGWVRHTVEWTAQATTSYLRLYSPQGTAYWDDISVGGEHWTDLSSRLLEVPSVKVGVDDDLSDMQTGSATFRLDNRDRALEPGYASGAYYPNVRPLRRIRYLINDGSTDWPQFFGYITSWGPVWPGGMNQEAVIQAVDGTMIFEMDTLPLLDPPTASSYEEVVQFDDPWGYYRLGETGGTRAVAVFRKVGSGKKRRRVRAGARQVTASELGGVAGAAGRYDGLPTLGRPGLILGDSDTCVRFTGDSTASQLAVVVTDANSFSSRQAFTVEAWIKPVATDAVEVQQYVTGPSSATAVMFNLYAEAGASGNFILDVENSAATLHTVNTGVDATVGVTRHVVGMLDGKILRVFIDGAEVATLGFTGLLPVASDTQALTVGGTFGTSAFEIDEVAVYEHALTAGRVLAHYQAGAERGYAAQLAGVRVAAVATSDLWAETDMDAGAHEIEPAMQFGQPRWDEIKDAVRAETPSGLFYFPGVADPRYLGWDYGDSAPYNTVQAIFGNNPGEIPFLDAQTTDEDDLYNIVTTSREGGLAQTATDEDSRAEFYDRSYELTGLTHTEDMSCLTVAHAILADHSQPEPPVLIKSVTLTGDTTSALAEILERMPGDLVRVKHRPKGGTAIDIITRIRGRTLTVSPLDGGNRVISCTWTLARGFNAAVAEWRLGVTGYSELQTTTVLG